MAKRGGKDISASLFGSQGSVDVLTGLGAGGGRGRDNGPRRMGAGGGPRGGRDGGSSYIARRFGDAAFEDNDRPQQGWGRGGGGGGGYGRDRDDRRGGGYDDRRGGYGDREERRGGGGWGRGGAAGGGDDDRGYSRGGDRAWGGRREEAPAAGGGGLGGGAGAYVPPSRRNQEGGGGMRYSRDGDRNESVFQDRRPQEPSAGGWSSVRSKGSAGGRGADSGKPQSKPRTVEADEKLKQEAADKRKKFELDEKLADLALAVDDKPSKFAECLQEGAAVDDAKELQEGLGEIDQADEEQLAALARVISKSLGAGSVNLAGVLEALKGNLKAAVAAGVLLNVFRLWRDGRSKQALRDMIEASSDNDAVLGVLYPQLDENMAEFLEQHDLSFLRSTGTIKEQVLAVFEQHKADDAQAVAAAMTLIQDQVDDSLPLDLLLPEVSQMLAKRVFAEDNLHLAPVSTFAPLLRRTLQGEPIEVQARLLFVLQGAWFKAKKHKDVVKLFKALSYNDYPEEGIEGAKILQDGAYYVWKEDLEDKTPGKPMLLIKVFSYIDTLTPPNPEPEALSEDEEDDDAEEEEFAPSAFIR